MNYAYRCVCGHAWDVVKSLADIERVEPCEKCSQPGKRFIAGFTFYGADDWDKAEWNPAFGCVVRNRKHRAQLAKERGLIEIGNEDPNKIHAHYEAQRASDNERRWREAGR